MFGWGFNFAGAERFWGKDTVVYQVAYGNGIERYINDTSGLGIDAAVSSLQNPHIQALPVVATYGSLQHFWSERVRSSAFYSFVQVQNTEAQLGGDIPPGKLHRRQPDLESLRVAHRGRRIPVRLERQQRRINRQRTQVPDHCEVQLRAKRIRGGGTLERQVGENIEARAFRILQLEATRSLVYAERT